MLPGCDILFCHMLEIGSVSLHHWPWVLISAQWSLLCPSSTSPSTALQVSVQPAGMKVWSMEIMQFPVDQMEKGLQGTFISEMLSSKLQLQQPFLQPGRRDLPGSNSKPADVLIPNWTHGKDTALDVTVVNPIQPTLVKRVARDSEPGYALTYAFDNKMRKHDQTCRREGMVFLPMPIESLGGWHPETAQQAKKIGAAKAWQTGEDEDVAIAHLFQKLAVLLASGNDSLLLNRIPSFPDPQEDGVM